MFLGRLFFDQVAVSESGDKRHAFSGEDIGAEDENGTDGHKQQNQVVVGNAFNLVLLVRLKRDLLPAVNEPVMLVLISSRDLCLTQGRNLQRQFAYNSKVDVFAA